GYETYAKRIGVAMTYMRSRPAYHFTNISARCAHYGCKRITRTTVMLSRRPFTDRRHARAKMIDHEPEPASPQVLYVGPAPPFVGTRELPADPDLTDLPLLNNGDWVWGMYCAWFGVPDETPQRIRTIEFSYDPHVNAVMTYAAEHDWDANVIEDEFAIELRVGEASRLFRYPS